MIRKIEGLVKAARVTGAKVQKLPYPLDGPSLSNADNAKDAAEAAEWPHKYSTDN